MLFISPKQIFTYNFWGRGKLFLIPCLDCMEALNRSVGKYVTWNYVNSSVFVENTKLQALTKGKLHCLRHWSQSRCIIGLFSDIRNLCDIFGSLVQELQYWKVGWHNWFICTILLFVSSIIKYIKLYNMQCMEKSHLKTIFMTWSPNIVVTKRTTCCLSSSDHSGSDQTLSQCGS